MVFLADAAADALRLAAALAGAADADDGLPLAGVDAFFGADEALAEMLGAAEAETLGAGTGLPDTVVADHCFFEVRLAMLSCLHTPASAHTITSLAVVTLCSSVPHLAQLCEELHSSTSTTKAPRWAMSSAISLMPST